MVKFETNKSVCVLGLGYIGLPTAAILASRHYKVLGVDINPSIIDTLSFGKSHIDEPDLQMLVDAAISTNQLRLSNTVEPSDIFIVAVETPINDDRAANLTAMMAAVDSIAPNLKTNDLIILESTCPVGTTESIANRLKNLRPDLSFPEDVHIAYCPERVLPGQIIKEVVENDRVIGGLSQECTTLATAFYKSFVKGQCLQANSKTAEMSKLVENCYRDVNIAFANELSMICDDQGINVWELIELANRHPRVNILSPGPGVGGHCISVDPWFLIAQIPGQTRLIKAARDVNQLKTQWALQKIDRAILQFQSEKSTTPTIALLGITYKPNVEDLRESPALEIAESLAEKYPSQIIVVEPNLDALPEKLLKQSALHLGIEEVSKRADIVVVLVAHDEFKNQVFTTDKTLRVIDLVGIGATNDTV
jgi:UDP-N-acetyl-D-mannosaminuronic acid dehydrogenase